MDDFINSCNAPKPVGCYPHAKRVGNLLFLSGIGPRERGSDVIPGVTVNKDGAVIDYDIAAQCKSVFQNIRFVLEEAGSEWENIVDVTVFLTNMEKDFDVYNALYKEYFSGPFPTRTTVEVTSLPTPISIELKIIATI